jgi:DNA topoisomerase-1
VYIEGIDDKAREGEGGADARNGRRAPASASQGRRQAPAARALPEQHFTQPPPRFSQATLIKEMEEQGIGRPSTYASILGVILEKQYVTEDDSRRLHPTELGMLVTDLLVESFPDIFNVEFTAGMEEILDGVEEGREGWVQATRPLLRALHQGPRARRRAHARRQDAGDPDRSHLRALRLTRWSSNGARRGEFVACKNYPDCRNTKNFTRGEDGSIQIAKEETIDRICPKVRKPMQIRFGRFGRSSGARATPSVARCSRSSCPSRSASSVRTARWAKSSASSHAQGEALLQLQSSIPD